MFERHARIPPYLWVYTCTTQQLAAIGSRTLGADGSLDDALTTELLQEAYGPLYTVRISAELEELEIGGTGFIKHRDGSIHMLERTGSGYYRVGWNKQERVRLDAMRPRWLLSNARQ